MYDVCMAEFAWCTDIHLDFVRPDERIEAFAETLCASDPAGILITGDISTSEKLLDHLGIIERVTRRPVYFVCGNHDYYGSDVMTVRQSMARYAGSDDAPSDHLSYLSVRSFVPLTPKTVLVGHDGWYDALNGAPFESRFLMSDWCEIGDFQRASGGREYMAWGRLKDKQWVMNIAHRLAKEGVDHVQTNIDDAVRAGHTDIIVLTHFPPFKEAHVYAGRMGDDAAQPWYTSKLMGDMLLERSRANPGVMFRVLCGHTHGAFHGFITPNLYVKVGGAEYGNPMLQDIIEVE